MDIIWRQPPRYGSPWASAAESWHCWQAQLRCACRCWPNISSCQSTFPASSLSSADSRVNREIIAAAVHCVLHSDVVMVVRPAGPRSACSRKTHHGYSAVGPQLSQNLRGFRCEPLAHLTIDWPFLIGLVRKSQSANLFNFRCSADTYGLEVLCQDALMLFPLLVALTVRLCQKLSKMSHCAAFLVLCNWTRDHADPIPPGS